MKDSSNSLNTDDSAEQPSSWAFRLALCLLGPIFFLSGFFTQIGPLPVLFAPLPILYLHCGTADRKAGLLWSILAVVIGVTLCAAIKGPEEGLLFALISAIPALILGEILLRKKGPEAAVLTALLVTIFLCVGISWLYAKSKGQSLAEAAQQTLAENSKLMTEQVLSQKDSLPENAQNDLKQMVQDPSFFWKTFPGLGALVAVLLMMCILPCLALIRWNPKGFLRRTQIPRDFLRKWKTPDWFVWLALFFGIFLIFEVNYLSWLSRNCLIPIVLIYFFQGMSILAFFLDSLRLRGPIRVLIYGAGVFFVTPMVVSFGFFDLWFNFRSRQKAEEDKEP